MYHDDDPISDTFFNAILDTDTSDIDKWIPTGDVMSTDVSTESLDFISRSGWYHNTPLPNTDTETQLPC